MKSSCAFADYLRANEEDFDRSSSRVDAFIEKMKTAFWSSPMWWYIEEIICPAKLMLWTSAESSYLSSASISDIRIVSIFFLTSRLVDIFYATWTFQIAARVYRKTSNNMVEIPCSKVDYSFVWIVIKDVTAENFGRSMHRQCSLEAPGLNSVCWLSDHHFGTVFLWSYNKRVSTNVLLCQYDLSSFVGCLQ